MEIITTEFTSRYGTTPMIKISSPNDKSSAIVMHGFGGNKEEQLGLGFRIAEMGFTTYTVDLRGHGRNANALDLSLLDEVNALIESLRGDGKIVTIGHSLGGRLSLLSSADFRIGISPALDKTYSPQTAAMIGSLRGYRAVESERDGNFKLLNALPLVDESMKSTDLILFGSRDVPEIIEYCRRLADKGIQATKIHNALHGDIFLLDDTFREISTFLSVHFLLIPSLQKNR